MDGHIAELNAIAEAAQSGELENKYLTFWIDGQLFGVSIANVVQIVGMQKITPIPDSPAYAIGVIDLRGTILPVIDVRIRLKKPQAVYTDRTCIIIFHMKAGDFGFIVDGVEEVTDIPEARISPPVRAGGGQENTRYLTGIAHLGGGKGEQIILCIDAAILLGEENYRVLKKATEQKEETNEKLKDQ